MKYNHINIMLPTYKRWNTLLPLFLTSAFDTAADPSCLRLTLCVNKDDAGTIRYLKGLKVPAGVKLHVMLENSIQPNLSAYFNLIYDKGKFQDEDTLVSMFGDDMAFVTPGWDQLFLEAVNDHDGVGLFFGNDNYIAHGDLCVHFVMARKYVALTKHPFMHPSFPADMIDTVWYETARMSHTLHYMKNVIIQHNHSTKSPNDEWDETFRRLTPLQRRASTSANLKVAQNYASICAANIVELGYGKWE